MANVSRPATKAASSPLKGDPSFNKLRGGQQTKGPSKRHRVTDVRNS